MSIQESNVFTDKVVVNTTHLDEVDCVKKAFKVVRAMCGFGIPRLVKESITYRFLYEVMNGAIDLDCIADSILAGMLHTCFNDCSYNIINFIYPNRFKPWELIRAPSNYWSKETSIQAIKWLI